MIDRAGARMNQPKLLDVVALTRDLPDRRLVRGQVGTVVEQLAADVLEVEFSDDDGRTYATAAVPASHLLVLRYNPIEAA
jgi:hypothetical protein